MRVLTPATSRDTQSQCAKNIDHQMMQHAIMLARQAAERDEVPVGAVVYRGNQIVSEGYNLRESDTDPTAHAEIVAVRAAAKKLGEWRLSECSLAVTLEPCPMCAGALVNARLGRLVYGASDPKAGAVRTLYRLCNDTRLNHSVEVIGGVCAYECGQLLKDFFKRKREHRQASRQK